MKWIIFLNKTAIFVTDLTSKQFQYNFNIPKPVKYYYRSYPNISSID